MMPQVAVAQEELFPCILKHTVALSPTLSCTVHGGRGGSVSDPNNSFGPGGGGSDGVINCLWPVSGVLNTGPVLNTAGNDAKSGSAYGAGNGGSRIVGGDFAFISEAHVPFCKNYPNAPGYEQEHTICEGQSITICDSVPEGAILAEWDAAFGNPAQTTSLDINSVMTEPTCNPPDGGGLKKAYLQNLLQCMDIRLF